MLAATATKSDQTAAAAMTRAADLSVDVFYADNMRLVHRFISFQTATPQSAFDSELKRCVSDIISDSTAAAAAAAASDNKSGADRRAGDSSEFGRVLLHSSTAESVRRSDSNPDLVAVRIAVMFICQPPPPPQPPLLAAAAAHDAASLQRYPYWIRRFEQFVAACSLCSPQVTGTIRPSYRELYPSQYRPTATLNDTSASAAQTQSQAQSRAPPAASRVEAAPRAREAAAPAIARATIAPAVVPAVVSIAAAAEPAVAPVSIVVPVPAQQRTGVAAVAIAEPPTATPAPVRVTSPAVATTDLAQTTQPPLADSTIAAPALPSNDSAVESKAATDEADSDDSVPLISSQPLRNSDNPLRRKLEGQIKARKSIIGALIEPAALPTTTAAPNAAADRSTPPVPPLIAKPPPAPAPAPDSSSDSGSKANPTPPLAPITVAAELIVPTPRKLSSPSVAPLPAPLALAGATIPQSVQPSTKSPHHQQRRSSLPASLTASILPSIDEPRRIVPPPIDADIQAAANNALRSPQGVGLSIDASVSVLPGLSSPGQGSASPTSDTPQHRHRASSVDLEEDSANAAWKATQTKMSNAKLKFRRSVFVSVATGKNSFFGPTPTADSTRSSLSTDGSAVGAPRGSTSSALSAGDATRHSVSGAAGEANRPAPAEEASGAPALTLIPYVPRMLLSYLLTRAQTENPLAPLASPPGVTFQSLTPAAVAAAAGGGLDGVAPPAAPSKAKKSAGGVCITYPNACLLIADVSGFTKLNETFAAIDGGAEQVSFHLNQYFTVLLDTIAMYGGDCVKFAGDALICVFVAATEPQTAQPLSPSADGSHARAAALSSPTLRAVQCALALQKNGVYETKAPEPVPQTGADSNLPTPPPAVRLSLHIALSSGELYAIFCGGEDDEYEFFVCGSPFATLSAALDASSSGEVVVPEHTWRLVESSCTGALVPSVVKPPSVDSKLIDLTEQPVLYRVDAMNDAPPILTVATSDVYRLPPLPAILPNVLSRSLRQWIPLSVLEKLDHAQADWLAELRTVSVIFVNLKGLSLAKSGCSDPRRPHRVLRSMQKIIIKNAGYRRQFLVDDKGTTLIVVFGVPPFAHENDAVRAVKTAMEIAETLNDRLKCEFSIGVATGAVYVGSVGSLSRKEHAVVGDTVNSAARLSGKAMSLVDQDIAGAPNASFGSTDEKSKTLTATPPPAVHSLAAAPSPDAKSDIFATPPTPASSIMSMRHAQLLASKLPRKNRFILFDEATYAAVHSKIKCAARGEITVKGKLKKLKVYSPFVHASRGSHESFDLGSETASLASQNDSPANAAVTSAGPRGSGAGHFRVVSGSGLVGAGAMLAPPPATPATATPPVVVANTLVGREQETEEFQSLISSLKQQSTVASAWFVSGVAGVGKTILLRHWHSLCRRDSDFVTLFASAEATDRSQPFSLFAPLIAQLLSLDFSDSADATKRQTQLTSAVESKHRALLPLFNALWPSLGFKPTPQSTALIRDSNVVNWTRAFEELILSVFRVQTQSSARRPCVLFCEDYTNMDTASRSAIHSLLVGLRSCAIIVSSRPLERKEMFTDPVYVKLKVTPKFKEMEIDGLTHDQCVTIVCRKLTATMGGANSASRNRTPQSVGGGSPLPPSPAPPLVATSLSEKVSGMLFTTTTVRADKKNPRALYNPMFVMSMAAHLQTVNMLVIDADGCVQTNDAASSPEASPPASSTAEPRRLPVATPPASSDGKFARLSISVPVNDQKSIGGGKSPAPEKSPGPATNGAAGALAMTVSPRLGPKMPITKRGSLTSLLPLSAMMAAAGGVAGGGAAVFSNLSAGSLKNLIVQQLDKLNPKELLVCKLASVFGVEFDKKALAALYCSEASSSSKTAELARASSLNVLSPGGAGSSGPAEALSPGARPRNSGSNAGPNASTSSLHMIVRAQQQAQQAAHTAQLKELDFVLTSLEVQSIILKRAQSLIAFKEPLLQRACYDLLLHSQRLRLHSAVVTEYAHRELAGHALRDMLLIHYTAIVTTAATIGAGPLEASGIDPLILVQAKAYLEQEATAAAVAASTGSPTNGAGAGSAGASAAATSVLSPTAAAAAAAAASNVDTSSLLSPRTAGQSALFFGK